MSVVPIVILFLFAQVNGVLRSYENCAVLSVEYNAKLYWTIEGSLINIGFEGAFPKGYMGVGLSEDGTMTNSGAGSDAWAASYDINEPKILDLWITDRIQPFQDTNSLINKLVNESATLLSAEFTRPLDTGSDDDYVIIPGKPVFVVWAGNPSEKIGTQIPGHQVSGKNLVGATKIDFGVNSSCVTAQTATSWVSPSGDFRLDWAIHQNQINFTVTANTTGWASFGLNSSPSMIGADMYTGWVNDDTGQLTMLDSHAIGHFQPIVDTTNNILQPNGYQVGSVTTYSFVRDLDTGDPDDMTINSTSFYVVYAMGARDGNANNNTYSKHFKRGTGQIYFVFDVKNDTVIDNTTVANVTGNTWKSSNGDFIVSWYLNADNTEINYTVIALTTGWASIGFNSVPKMAGSDMYTAWVDDNTDALTVLDTYSTGQTLPTVDTRSDILRSYGYQDGDSTTFSFVRKINTEDPQDVAITNTSLYLLCAAGAFDGTGANYTQHTITYLAQINFLSGNVTSETGKNVSNQVINFDNGYSSVMGEGAFTLTWIIEGDIITFKMAARSIGWISFALGTSKSMAKSDCYIGWVQRDGVVNLMDTWVLYQEHPVEDTRRDGTDDTKLLSASENANGETIIIFSRKLKTGDNNDLEITRGLMNVLWATSDKDGSGRFYPQHKRFGSVRIDFFTGVSSRAGNEFRPGQLLLLIVCGLFILVTCCHWMLGYLRTTNKVGPDVDVPLSVRSFSSCDDLETVRIAKHYRKNYNATWNIFLGYLYMPILGTQITIANILVAVCYIAINIGCLFMETEYHKSFGSLVSANSLLSVIPATRNSIIVLLTGIPFDRTVMFHRWIGRFTLILLTIHVFWSWAFWVSNGKAIAEELTEPKFLYGLFGWISLILVFLTSLSWIRRKIFEIFYYSHVLVMGFLILGAFHAKDQIPYTIGALVIYAVDRIFRFIWGVLPSKALSVHRDDVNRIAQFRVAKQKIATSLLNYRAGQYVFVNFPQVSLLEWHPFSVTSGPEEPHIELNIKAVGGFTSKVFDYANENKDMYIRVDGPYGNLNNSHLKTPVVLLVAGGIGITPALSILNDIYKSQKKPRFQVENVYLIWTVPNESSYTFFGSHIQEFESLNGVRPVLPKFKPIVYLTKENKENDKQFLSGRPNFKKSIKEITMEVSGKKTFVFACGPSTMIRDCRNAVNQVQKDGYPLVFHEETFEL